MVLLSVYTNVFHRIRRNFSFIQVITNQPRNNNNDTASETGTKRKRFLMTPTPTTELRSILDKPPLNGISTCQSNIKKNKTTTITDTTSLIDKSFSQLSISPSDVQKTKVTTDTTTSVEDKNNSVDNESSINYLEQFKPRYLKVSDRIFKQILANTIENGFKLVESLNTVEKIHTVREMTEITNNLYYKDFQQNLWQEYAHVSSKGKNWESKVAKRFARQNNTCQMYRPNKSYIQERLTTISKQKERTRNQLQENLTKLLNDTQHWQPSIDATLLSHTINEFVRHNQKRLKLEFEHKKEMVALDWNDHQLLMKFYELEPNDELIQLAREIWQVTADELTTKGQEEILRKRIYLKRLPTKLDQTINDLVNENKITLSNPILDPDQRASFASRCSKTIAQCKFNLMHTQLDEFAVVMHRYELSLSNLKEKLFHLQKQNPHLYTTSLLNIIEERRQAMIQRAVRIRQYKLKTFFDEAPTVVNNN